MSILRVEQIRFFGGIYAYMAFLARKTVDEIAASGGDEDMISTFRNTVMVFKEDGTAETQMRLPEDITQEQIDAAIEEGTKILDGWAVISTEEWKTKDGKNLYNTGREGEVLGEEVSPWVEIKEIGDMIEIDVLCYVRAE